MVAWVQNYSALDYLIFAVAFFLVVRGFLRGCSGELGFLIGIAAAAAVLIFEGGPVENIIRSLPIVRESAFACQVLTLTVMLVVCVSVWLLVGHLFSRLIKLAVSQPLDAILGGVLGTVKVLLLICILCVIGLISSRGEGKGTAGFLQKWSSVVQRVTPWIKPFLPSK